MRPIIVLEPNIANKIAAGEVVERPASIVKELLENSLDAGALSVTVEIKNGGIDHIRITDNGCGIPENEVKLAFMRHATSKLTSIDELSSLSSFGFRGEALASIAAVSRTTIRTRVEDSEYGVKLCVDGGKFSETEPCACPRGTTIEVDELFYNVPARLKFVKNTRTEAAMITDYVSRIMLANPDVSIKLINAGRTVLHTTGDGSLANAVLCVYGSSVFASMYEVNYDDGYISVKGYVGGETTARSNRIQQSVFINKRYVKSQLVSNAVQRAFLTRLMNHRFPFFVLNVLVSSREVDVNVHPNKLSVRFTDEERVASAVTAAINAALNGSPVSVSAAELISQPYTAPQGFISKPAQANESDAARAEIQDEFRKYEGSEKPPEKSTHKRMEERIRSIFKSDGGTFTPVIPQKGDGAYAPLSKGELPFSGNYSAGDFMLKDSGASAYPDFTAKPVNSPAFIDDAAGASADEPERREDGEQSKPRTENGIPVYTARPFIPAIEPEAAVKTEQIALDADTCAVIGAAFDTYIIVQQGDAVYFIDQHAAHERMLYEKLISGSLKFDSQFLTPPMEMEFDPLAYDCLVQNAERFMEFGYSLEYTDGFKALVHAVPSIMDASYERFLRDAVDMMLEYPKATETDLMRSRLIQMSCKRAVKAGNDLEIRQLKAIVDAYASGEVPLTCPHGRPVMIRITKTELEKMFKRIV